MNKKIPHGSSCYSYLQSLHDGTGRVKVIDPCPHWVYKKKFGMSGAYCRYLRVAAIEGNPWLLIWERSKECGVNDNEVVDN